MDGRFGRCQGCSSVRAFCGVCASVKARCKPCAKQRRLELHRKANRLYSTSPAGRAAGKARQKRSRTARRGPVTDAISTQELTPETTASSPSSSIVEAPRTKEVVPHDSQPDSRPHSQSQSHPHCQPIAVRRCARCGRVLSGRMRPSERSPERRRRRRPRLPSHVRAP